MALEPKDPQRPTQAERDAAQKILDTPILAEFQPYPAWRYHADGRSHLVRSKAEEDDLGHGWSGVPTKDAPAKPAPDAVVPIPVTIVPPVVPLPGQPMPPAAHLPGRQPVPPAAPLPDHPFPVEHKLKK